jgi:TM2 domain-containing membrane protein YozV
VGRVDKWVALRQSPARPLVRSSTRPLSHSPPLPRMFPSVKEKGTAYILWAGCFLGLAGLQRLYAGKIGTGLLYLFTWGLFGIGQAVDLFLIPQLVDDANNRLALEGVDVRELGRGGAAGLLTGKRIPRTTEEFQVALVQAAEKHGGRLTAAEAVSETGRGFKDVKKQLDDMTVNGYIELDSDDDGQEFYHFPGLGEQQ